MTSYFFFRVEEIKEILKDSNKKLFEKKNPHRLKIEEDNVIHLLFFTCA